MSKVSLKILPGRTATRSGRPSLTRRASGNRTGTIYIAVLGVALTVAALGTIAFQIARIELHHAVTADGMTKARLAAQSGVEYAISVINSNPDWRTGYQSGVPVSLEDESCTLTGTGKFSFALTDSDGELANDVVTLQATGVSGNAKSVIEVRLEPAGEGLNCLDSPPDGDNPLEMPDPNDVFAYYKANGTWLQRPADGMITQVVLSPAINPYDAGITNKQGIYVIDCQGEGITLKDCRIVGTLVLLNVGSGAKIENSILMESAASNFPTLMVQGSLAMDWSPAIYLIESVLNANLNPVGTPLDGYGEDHDLLDGPPSKLKGLVYVTGNLSVQNKPAKIDGVVVVGGETTISSQLTLNYDAGFSVNPPPGFVSGSKSGGKMKIVPGTWQRVKSATP